MGGLGPGGLDSWDPRGNVNEGYPDSNPKPPGPKPTNLLLVDLSLMLQSLLQVVLEWVNGWFQLMVNVTVDG